MKKRRFKIGLILLIIYTSLILSAFAVNTNRAVISVPVEEEEIDTSQGNGFFLFIERELYIAAGVGIIGTAAAAVKSGSKIRKGKIRNKTGK